MSDIRFNQWLHQSGTGGVSQVASGAVGVGTTNPLADFYVRGDAQITGILTAGHIAMGSSITFGDDDRAYFGNATDLQIYHDGTDSIIDFTNTAHNLRIRGDNEIRLEARYNELSLKAIKNGAVELYHDNSKKIETTSTGVSVTGTVVASGAATLGNGSGLNWGDTSARIRGESGSSGLLRFDTNGGERLRIDSSGRVLIGTTTEGFAEADDLTVNSADHGGITIIQNA